MMAVHTNVGSLAAPDHRCLRIHASPAAVALYSGHLSLATGKTIMAGLYILRTHYVPTQNALSLLLAAWSSMRRDELFEKFGS